MTLGKFVKTLLVAALLTFFVPLVALWAIAYCKGYTTSEEPRKAWTTTYDLEAREAQERAAWGSGPPGTWTKRK